MITYKSKIGLELVLPSSLLIGGLGISFIYDRDWLNVGILSLISLFIAHLLLTTYYQIERATLRIRSGFFVNKSLNIESITKIVETRNPAGAPAASTDRLELVYNQFDYVLVSPKDKVGFIQELLTVKPTIDVRLNHRKCA